MRRSRDEQTGQRPDRLGTRRRPPAESRARRVARSATLPSRPMHQVGSSRTAMVWNRACTRARRSSMPRRIAVRRAGKVVSKRTGKPERCFFTRTAQPKRRAARPHAMTRCAGNVPPTCCPIVRSTCGGLQSGRKATPRAATPPAAAQSDPIVKIAPRWVLMLPVAQHLRLRRDAFAFKRSEVGSGGPKDGSPKNAWRSANKLRMNVRASMSRWLPLSTNDTSPGFGSSASSSVQRRHRGAADALQRRFDRFDRADRGNRERQLALRVHAAAHRRGSSSAAPCGRLTNTRSTRPVRHNAHSRQGTAAPSLNTSSPSICGTSNDALSSRAAAASACRDVS